MRYGYNDPRIVTNERVRGPRFWIHLLLALVFISAVWIALDAKILFGDDWLSETYDRPDWRTNEGDLSTYGMWDLEAHIWKSEYIRENFPNHEWNPHWYLGSPLLKYYQLSFYAVHIGFATLFELSLPRAANLLIIFAHLFATLLTFLLCLRFSNRIWASALASAFLLSNTFISLRSYGWEPITVVFLFLFPLGLLAYFRKPLEPLRIDVLIVLVLSYLSHPLIFVSLLMVMGLYLLAVQIKESRRGEESAGFRPLIQLVVLMLFALAMSAVQFLPQISYHQVTSGAHMGVSYLPFYQVAPNIIDPLEFFFDIGNLKGPGPIIMIATLLLVIFAAIDLPIRKRNLGRTGKHRVRTVFNHELVVGLSAALFTMVLLYYLELYNIFPMNILRSIQYHRIIPEFVIVAAALIAVLANLIRSRKQQVAYYALLTVFVLMSFVNIYTVQEQWATVPSIDDRPEFIHESFDGRMSVPYPDQSVSVRNSFTLQDQVYGYYEQGITNSYADEMMSVSSGFHNVDVTQVYLEAANIKRLYVNTEGGTRDALVLERFNSSFPWVHNGTRYGYFDIPIPNASFVQVIDGRGADRVLSLAPGCREIFTVEYCESHLEEFVTNDASEIAYLRAYNELLAEPYDARVRTETLDPGRYLLHVQDATRDTAIVVKMTYDESFVASVDGVEVRIEAFGPDYLLIRPEREGNFTVDLDYRYPLIQRVGAYVSLISTVLILFGFLVWPLLRRRFDTEAPFSFARGDLR